VNWYLEALRKYSDFAGRARRREYWFFVLFNTLIQVAAFVLDGVVGTFRVELGVGLLSGVYSLAVLVPSFAVLARRLHDTDRSGWWILIGIVPLLGALVLMILALFEGDPGENRFGPSPKAPKDPALGF
jgi:uncharacterized membrane protein YhaH (DUF805 family)